MKKKRVKKKIKKNKSVFLGEVPSARNAPPFVSQRPDLVTLELAIIKFLSNFIFLYWLTLRGMTLVVMSWYDHIVTCTSGSNMTHDHSGYTIYRVHHPVRDGHIYHRWSWSCDRERAWLTTYHDHVPIRAGHTSRHSHMDDSHHTFDIHGMIIHDHVITLDDNQWWSI